MTNWLAILLLLLAATALLMRGEASLIWGLDTEEFAALAAGLGLVLLILPAAFGGYRGRVSAALRDVLSWSAIGLVLMAGYSYRFEIGEVAYRIAGEFTTPGAPVAVDQGSGSERAVRVRRRGDGHFVANVVVNGAGVPMLIDTGASTVVLRQVDAKKLGIDTGRLKYTVPVQTANGLTYAAHARLREVSIGAIQLTNIDALVAQPGAMKESLLGMTFLSRLRSYEFSGEFLTFRN